MKPIAGAIGGFNWQQAIHETVTLYYQLGLKSLLAQLAVSTGNRQQAIPETVTL